MGDPWWDKGAITERHCQQWTINKHAFLVTLWKGLDAIGKIDPHILAAWMAVESGGSLDNPGSGRYNYLQIKGRAGFADYATPITAARAAVSRIKAEPAIRKAIKNRADASTKMTAIAVAWDDATGVPKNIPKKPLVGPEAEYRQRLQDKYDCIDGYQVAEDVGMVGGPNGFLEHLGNLVDPEFWGAGAKVGGEIIAESAPRWVTAVWPVLLQTAGAATGLALIGYGITQLAKSPTAGEHVKKAAPIAAEVIS